MIIGSGMIAKRFGNYADDQQVLVFASGVSNSGSKVADDYKREEQLLRNAIQDHPQKMLVYFSTCSIYDPSLQQSVYVKHKLQMEGLIHSSASSYIIFRVSNPVGFTNNRHTVLNYFASHIRGQEHFSLWQYASRNLIDMDDVFNVCDHIIQKGGHRNSIVNIANPVNYPVASIIQALENHFSIKGNYSLEKKGNSPLVDTTAIQSLFGQLQIEFDNNYLEALLQKYFPLS